VPHHTLRLSPVAGGIAVAIGVLAGLAKMPGINRWLVLMPGRAGVWTDPGTTEATRNALAALFVAFNA